MKTPEEFHDHLQRGRKSAIEDLRKQELGMVRSAYQEAFGKRHRGWHVILGKHLYDALERITDPTKGLGAATGVEFSLLSLPELDEKGDAGPSKPLLRASQDIDTLIQMTVTASRIDDLTDPQAPKGMQVPPEMVELAINGSLKHTYQELSRALNLAALHYLRDLPPGSALPDSGLQAFALKEPLRGGATITNTFLDVVPIPLPSRATYLGLAASGSSEGRLGCYVFGVGKQDAMHAPQISIIYRDLFQRAVRSYEKAYGFVERHAPANPKARRPSPGRT